MTDSLSDQSALPATDESAHKRADVSRQQILAVAATLFCARGYAGTSLRDIAAAAGMKAGSLYYHFASKEELTAEVLRIGVERGHRDPFGPHRDNPIVDISYNATPEAVDHFKHMAKKIFRRH